MNLRPVLPLLGRKELDGSKNDICLPDAFDKMGPSYRVNAPQKAPPGSQEIARLLSAGMRNNNILDHVRSTNPSEASGANCYLSF